MATISKEELVKILEPIIPKPPTEEERKNQMEEMLEALTPKFIEVFNDKFAELSKAQENKMQKIEHETKDDQPKWKGFGEQLNAVRSACIPNGYVDKRLVGITGSGEVINKAISGASELIGHEGGYLVSPEYSKEILTVSHNTGIVAKDCRHLKISGNRIIINAIEETSRATGSRWGGVRGYWVAEGGTATSSQIKLRQVDLKLNKLEVVSYATEELLEDQTAHEGLTTQAVGEEFAFMLDDAIINGTGGGQPLGVRNCAALVTKTKETGQVASTVVAENISGMWNLLPATNRKKSKWYIIQDVEPELEKMGYKLGTAAIAVYMPPGGLSGNSYATLKSRPIEVIEQCQALGSEGDILLLDLKQYLIIEKASGVQAASSIHVRFLNHERTYRFTMRIDGQPMWNSAVTSYTGSVDRSPYVTLAARS